MNGTEYLNVFLFVYLPYLAAGFFVCGLIYRVKVKNSSVQALSSQFVSNDRMLKVGSNLFHYAIILVFLGHIFGMLTPEWAYNWLITNEQKRDIAVVMGGISGIVALVGITMLVIRRFTNSRVFATSHFSDLFIALLVWVQILLGLMGTCVTVQSPLQDYMNIDYWLQDLCTFVPDPEHYLRGTSLIHMLHIINGFLIILIFPFTKLMHMVALPVRYLVNAVLPGKVKI
jgi:nitrate reductase gamma subunit